MIRIRWRSLAAAGGIATIVVLIAAAVASASYNVYATFPNDSEGGTGVGSIGQFAASGLTPPLSSLPTSPPPLTLLTPPTVPLGNSCELVNGACVTGNAPSIVVTPNGKYVYATNDNTLGEVLPNDGTIMQFTVGKNATLAPMSPAQVPDNAAGPLALAVTPNGKYAYVVNFFSSSVSEFTIGKTGGLTPSGSVSFPGYGPTLITLSPNGEYAYVNGLTSTAQYTIDAATGSLTLASSVPTTAFDDMTITPSGKFVYAVTSTAMQEFTVGKTGGLTPSATTVVLPNRHAETGIAAAPGNVRLYLTDGGDLVEYKIGKAGVVSLATLTPIGDSAVALHPVIDGALLYAIDGADAIDVFDIATTRPGETGQVNVSAYGGAYTIAVRTQ